MFVYFCICLIRGEKPSLVLLPLRLFTEEQVNALYDTTLRDIILEITDIDEEELAENPFFFLTGLYQCVPLG